MSSFYDRWFRLAQFCAERRVDPALACEMHRRRLQQAQAYYTWVSRRRDARKAAPHPDPAQYPAGTPLLDVDWLYGEALEEWIGALPRSGLYEWARAGLEKLERMSPDDLYGPEGTVGLGDVVGYNATPWGLFTLMVVGMLHTFAHFVGRQTPYSDNPYRFGRRMPGWEDADEWARRHGFPETL
jgi:hypothetical protein